MTGSPLIISPEVVAKLAVLKVLGERQPVNIHDVMTAVMTPGGKAKHIDQMNLQTIIIPGPWPYYVTYSVETGHPVGTARHMSMSVDRKGHTPSPVAVWMVAEYLGFTDKLCTCEAVYYEDLSDGGRALNIVQVLKATIQ